MDLSCLISNLKGVAFAPGQGGPVLYVATSDAVFSYHLGQTTHKEVGRLCDIMCVHRLID